MLRAVTCRKGVLAQGGGVAYVDNNAHSTLNETESSQHPPPTKARTAPVAGGLRRVGAGSDPAFSHCGSRCRRHEVYATYIFYCFVMSTPPRNTIHKNYRKISKNIKTFAVVFSPNFFRMNQFYICKFGCS